MQAEDQARLSKIMAQRGLCSRREADALIAAGLVKVNGEVVSTLGTKVPLDAVIEVLPRGQQALDDKVTILLNKPIGYVSSQPEDNHVAAITLITPTNQDGSDRAKLHPRHLRGLATAGRLDIDSQGLLIFTQDGVLAKKLIGENSSIDKEYIVRVAGQLRPDDLKLLRTGGLIIEGRKLKPAHVEWINQDQLRFVLREGMKRQIRKMCEAVGLKVLGLKRVRIGKIVLGSLQEGNWRFLHHDESF